MLLLSKAIRLVALISVVSLFSPLNAQTFGVKQRIFTGPSPYGIKAVDINKDGNQDLIWFSSNHNVEIRLGEGNGLFALSGPIYDTGLQNAGEFEVADLNRDGHLDIIAAGDHGIVVLRGNGDGTFKAPLTFTVSSSGQDDAIDSLALGDFNSDGKIDAVVSIGTAIQIAFGKGDGTFQSPAKVYPNGLTGQHFGFPGQLSAEAEAGDFDGDGKLDVAFYTCCDTSDDSLLFGGTIWAWYGDGAGNFPVKKAVQTDVNIVRIKVFDINRDGKADILNVRKSCHDSCTFGVITFLYAGSRTFQLQGASIPSGGFSIDTGLTFGDFDLDGNLDLATGAGTGPGGFFVFRRNSNGTFDEPQLRNLGTSESEPSEIISADLNNDKKSDLAITFGVSNTILVLLNTSTPPGGCSSGPILSVHICSPINNATTKSPVHIVARSNSDRTVTSWKIYVDGVAKSSGTGANINSSITLGSYYFARHIEIKSWDAQGRNFASSVSVAVQ